MIELGYVYLGVGALLAAVAWQTWRDPIATTRSRRAATTAFWMILAMLFLLGDVVPPVAAGAAVLALAALAGSGLVGLRAKGVTALAAAQASAPPGPRATAGDAATIGADAATTAPAQGHGAAPAGEGAPARQPLGNRLLVPVLLIPLGALAGTLGLARVHLAGQPLLPPAQATLVSLGLACALALVVALAITRERLPTAIGEGRRLLDAIGWAVLLPSLLATLGGVLTQAQVGAAVADLVTRALPVERPTVAVLAYGAGMTLLTMIMGNAFAAFPVMTAGIGLPLLVKLHGADPAALGAIGMLTGYCGTLMTPMAANFNIVPVALLGLPDQTSVIRAQVATAVPLFVINLALLYWLALP